MAKSAKKAAKKSTKKAAAKKSAPKKATKKAANKTVGVERQDGSVQKLKKTAPKKQKSENSEFTPVDLKPIKSGRSKKVAVNTPRKTVI